MQQEERITLNVCGRRFEVSRKTLALIPMFNNAPHEPSDGEIFIERSPLVFEQVLALVLDPKHPFPLAYAYELDYYGIEYEPLALTDELGTLNTLTVSLAAVQESVRTLPGAVTRLEEKAMLIATGVAHSVIGTPRMCRKKGCGTNPVFNGWCRTHLNICCYSDCKTVRLEGHNQCEHHLARSTYCHVRECPFQRRDGTRDCFYHNDAWKNAEKT